MNGHSDTNLGAFKLTTTQKKRILEKIERSLIFNDLIIIKIKKRKTTSEQLFRGPGGVPDP